LFVRLALGAIMKTVLLVTIPRILLGLLFLVSAIDGFWWLATGNHLIHPPTSARGLAFEAALQESGFFWPLLKSVNLVGALSLLTNIAPALGLALIAPVMTVIVLFHLVINPQGIPVAVILVVLGGLLVWAYRGRYAALLR
jgi:ABC-type sugar transport system permease subunit